MTTTISSLTHHISSNTKQINLSSTLPTKLYRIQSLQRFNCLLSLNLSNNNITKIENLSNLCQLKRLNLQFNQIKVVENLQKLNNLQELLLGYNAIVSIDPRLQQNIMLKKIDLSYNMIAQIDQIKVLFNLYRLQSLCLQGNSFISRLNYTLFIKTLMPRLRLLDNKDICLIELEDQQKLSYQGQLSPQQQVIVLRDTLNKLLEQRNYLVEELQNLTNNTSNNNNSPLKINLKQYLKYHYSYGGEQRELVIKQVDKQQYSNQNQCNQQARVSTLSPIKQIDVSARVDKVDKRSQQINKINTKNKNNSVNKISLDQSQAVNISQSNNQREKMIQIFRYWLLKMEQKLQNKKRQNLGLHQYYMTKLNKNKNIFNSISQQGGLQVIDDEDDFINDHIDNYKILIVNKQERQQKQIKNKYQKRSNKIDTRQLLQKIKQNQNQVNVIKQQINSINNLIQQMTTLPKQQQLYKFILIRVLFGSQQPVNLNKLQSNYSKNQVERKKSLIKRQQHVNYRQLKKFLISQYGVINVIADLAKIIFGLQTIQFTKQRLAELKKITQQKSLMQIIAEYKEQQKLFKKEKRLFQKQKQQYLTKLQHQTQQLYDKWQQFNHTKTSYQLQKGRQIRYENKLIQQKQQELLQRYKQLQQVQYKKVQKLQQRKQLLQNQIYQMEQKLQQLQNQQQRSTMQLNQCQRHVQSIDLNKQQLNKLTNQLSLIKKHLFLKQNLLQEMTQKLKHFSLQEQIASQRLRFLQQKCVERLEEMRQKEQEERKMSQQLNKLVQEQINKHQSITQLKNKLTSLQQQQSNMTKLIERNRQNLAIYENKLKNLSQIELHKKKSIQQLQVRIQELKLVQLEMTDRNNQLQQILIRKQQSIHGYMMKINQSKRQLQSYTDMTKNMQMLIQRQAELKKSILQLEIQNGNLIDFKNQFIRQKRNLDYGQLIKSDWINHKQ